MNKYAEHLYKIYSQYYRQLGFFDKQFESEKKMFELSKSIQNINKTRQLSELEIQYETHLKDTDIRSKKKLLAFKDKQQNYMLVGIILLFLLLGASTYFYRQKLNVEKNLSEQEIKKILESQKLETLKAQMSGQNTERARIAKDLHDGISGNLAAIKLKLSKLIVQTEDVKSIVESVDSTYDEVRTISHDLIPKEIYINSFTDLLKQLIDFKSSTTLKISSEFFPKKNLNQLSEKLQVELYRIIQELLTNIQKHAKATEAFVNLTHHDEELSLIIEDNGQGFSTSKKEGIGLKNIKSRLATINGTINIESKTKLGSMININIELL